MLRGGSVRSGVWWLVLCVVLWLVVGCVVGVGGAVGAGGFGWWGVGVGSEPSGLVGGGSGVVVVSVANLGDGVVRGSVESPVLVSVALPAGVRVVGCGAGQVEGCGVSGFAGEGLERGKLGELTCPTGETLEQTVVCRWEGEVPAFDLLEVRVHVRVEESAVDGEQVDVDVSGGGAPDASVKRPLTVGGGEVFGVQSFGL